MVCFIFEVERTNSVCVLVGGITVVIVIFPC